MLYCSICTNITLLGWASVTMKIIILILDEWMACIVHIPSRQNEWNFSLRKKNTNEKWLWFTIEGLPMISYRDSYLSGTVHVNKTIVDDGWARTIKQMCSLLTARQAECFYKIINEIKRMIYLDYCSFATSNALRMTSMWIY